MQRGRRDEARLYAASGLTQRKDLTPAELEPITAELALLLDQETKEQGDEEDFVIFLPFVCCGTTPARRMRRWCCAA